MSIIETHNLTKTYGRIEALKGVSLRVEKGQIYGLLGQNGAGKTTLIKILLGLVRLTEGAATLLGQPAGTVGVRRRVGYLPEDHQFPHYHTAYSLMDFYGSLYGVPASVRRRKIPETLELVGIAGRMHSKIKTYSKGMKQRLGIAQALMHDPELIILDEPTDGVDPMGRKEIRELMATLKQSGHTIFLNSHLLGEVEMICDRVAILQRGQLVREGTIAELTQQKGLYVLRLAEGQSFPVEAVTQRGYTVRSLAEPPGAVEIAMSDGQTIDPVIQLLVERGLSLRHLVEQKQTLEDVFMKTVEAAEPGVDRQRRRGAARPVGGGN
ncbi:MAG: ABC transporter ATP-binding protein [Gemmataceae bacterium]|nr:ABC transporter ATP-binding protein [Gemmata sp.]MDW8198288.1 ABC transporter ATP-binding protein [Gemmataceae bacterium]